MSYRIQSLFDKLGEASANLESAIIKLRAITPDLAGDGLPMMILTIEDVQTEIENIKTRLSRMEDE